MNFLTPKSASDAKSFLGTGSMTYWWVSNFVEIFQLLSRFKGKVEWRWTQAKELSLKILKVKCFSSSAMHGLNFFLPCHFYVDASRFVARLAITQKLKVHSDDSQAIYAPIIYNSFPFSKSQCCYPTYKWEICGLVKFIIKYDYLYKHPHFTTLIHTNQKLLTFFTSSEVHERVYGYCIDQIHRLNVRIVYIPGPRNKVAHGLSRTIFRKKDCFTTNNLYSEALAHIKTHRPI